jgi:hypothetical protein
MTALSEMGAIIAPPLREAGPLDDMVGFTVGPTISKIKVDHHLTANPLGELSFRTPSADCDRWPNGRNVQGSRPSISDRDLRPTAGSMVRLH